MKVLVTGNQGYVGTVMTPLLAAAGHEVWGLDTGFYEDCLLGPAGESGVARQIVKDVRDVEAFDLAGVEAVVHLAALSNDPLGALNPALTEAINHQGSMRLARAAKQAGASRFLFASSCSIYGQGGGAALTEEASFQPLTAYAVSKVETEAGLRELADDAFSPVYLRNATAYGFSPRLRLDIVVNNLTGWAVTTGKVRLLSDGRAWRPLVHVEDMSRAFVAALAAPRERIHDQAFNVGREQDNRRIRDLATAVAGIVPDCEVTIAEGAATDARDYNVSFAKVRRLLPEFVPQWDVERGIRQLHKAYVRHRLDFARFDGREFTRLKQLQHLLATQQVGEDLMWAVGRTA
jgi:nucleoside-diphosphate-sugar epimerase